MDYQPLGTSGLKISALTLGTMTFGGAGLSRQHVIEGCERACGGCALITSIYTRCMNGTA